jgi:hypothetical protein
MDPSRNVDSPYLMAAQSQKHVAHDETVRVVDVLV